MRGFAPKKSASAKSRKADLCHPWRLLLSGVEHGDGSDQPQHNTPKIGDIGYNQQTNGQ